MDRTSKVLLALIALGLFANAARDWVPVARAADPTVCRIEGPIEVKISSIGDDLEVKWGFSQPGSSSSSPLYVRQSQ